MILNGWNNVARWNGLEILIPKHMWKSKIGLLEQIWGQNPYGTFFLGHPVYLTRDKYKDKLKISDSIDFEQP